MADNPISETTDISNLPSTTDIPVQNQPALAPTDQITPVTLSQSTIEQITACLNQAGSTGATSLQSRDIPMNTLDSVTDPSTSSPNYIPPPTQTDYIHQPTNILQNQALTSTGEPSFLENIQTPLIIAIIYFIFQLPIVKLFVFKHLPKLCSSDGNYNMFGMIITSALFGGVYMMIMSIFNDDSTINLY